MGLREELFARLRIFFTGLYTDRNHHLRKTRWWQHWRQACPNCKSVSEGKGS